MKCGEIWARSALISASIRRVRDWLRSASSSWTETHRATSPAARTRTADSRVYWLEEAFYEDAALYRRLRAWMRAEGLSTMLADGEGRGMTDPGLPDLLAGEGFKAAVGALAPHALVLDMVREGILDVLQWDVLAPGLSRWLEVAPLVEQWGRLASPHHYGTHLGNYHECHLGLAVPNFGFVEWDEASTPGISAPGYAVSEGYASVPASPGFGLALDEDTFGRAVHEGGFAVTAPTA